MKKTFLTCSAIALITVAVAQCVGAQAIRITASPSVALSDGGIEVSGIALITGTQNLLLADDKTPDLFFVDPTTGTTKGTTGIGGINLDWEAMAKVDGNYFVVGSNSSVYRLSYDDRSNKIVIAAKVSVDRAEEIKGNRFEVEGLAARKLGDKIELSFGIRRDDSGKILVYRGVIVDNRVSLTQFFAFDTRTTQAVSWHLSSLEYVPELNGFFIMTTTESSRETNFFYGNKLWFVDENAVLGTTPKPTDKFKEVQPLSSFVFETEMKAEGLTLLSYDGQKKLAKVAIAYDNDRYNVNRLRPGAALPGKLQICEVSVQRAN